MKKIVLSLLAGLLYITTQSQVTFKPGVKLGLNIAKITNTNHDNRIGVYAGIFGELKLGSMYALQPEITYLQQGSKNIDLNYIAITIANKFYFLNEETPVYVVIGPSLDFKLDGKTESYNNQYSTGLNFDADFSLFGGFGYDFPFGLGVEARFKHGIIEVINFEGFSDGKRRLNAVIQIGAIYKFDFRK